MHSIRAYLEQLKIYIKSPISIFDNWAATGRLNWMPDKWYLSLKFRSRMGYWMSWKHPKTFNEKLQWLKVHDRNPLYTQLVDKYEVRKYIAKKIGEEYLIPLLGVWDDVEDIDFNKLPNQFVLKCTHDSGSVVICKDKTSLDFNLVKKKLKNHLSANYYYPSREWPYKNVKPRIIAEQYLCTNNEADVNDYKFQIFNGTFQNGFICSKRFSSEGLHVTFFDKQWNLLYFTKHYPREKTLINKTPFFEEMVKISEFLAKEIPFIRVDFLVSNSRFFFGELTFFPGAGFEEFSPTDWDFKMGNLLKIK